MDALAQFQHAFAAALWAPAGGDPAGRIAAVAAQPGFAVYRNTVMKGCIDALQANFPSVVRLVGEEWFRAAAAVHVRATPPADPMLLHYGSGFPAFLAHFEAAAPLPYLAGVAQLDRCWTEAHIARDEDTLDPALIAALTPQQLATTALQPHAAARWAWFDNAPVFSIWARNRNGDDSTWAPDWIGEGALLTRRHGAVEWCALDAAGCAFLDACATGATLAHAAQAALAVPQPPDLQQLMRTLLDAGAFSRLQQRNA